MSGPGDRPIGIMRSSRRARPPVVAGLHPANAVVYALVVAPLDLEQRRTRGKVRPPMRRSAR
jgi:hypothetical protein